MIESRRFAGFEQSFRRALHVCAWLSTATVLCVLISVGLDKSGHQWNTKASEFSWWLYSTLFLFGLSLALLDDKHVRVDVLANHWSPRARRWIDIIGTLFLLMPLCVVLIVKGSGYAWQAWQSGQGSSSFNGLPAYWIIKAMLPLGMLTLISAAILRLVQLLTYPYSDSEQ